MKKTQEKSTAGKERKKPAVGVFVCCREPGKQRRGHFAELGARYRKLLAGFASFEAAIRSGLACLTVLNPRHGDDVAIVRNLSRRVDDSQR